MRRASRSIDGLIDGADRRVQLSGGRDLYVRGSGHYTLYRHVGDTTSAWANAPYAGCWVLASPEFREEIERAFEVRTSVDAVDPHAADTGTPTPRVKGVSS